VEVIRFDGVWRVEYGVHMAIMYIPYAETNSWFHRKSKSIFEFNYLRSLGFFSVACSGDRAPGTP
jgi:hypothetical protein